MGKKRRVLERAVSHATRAGSMRALAGAQKELIALEREAFGLNADVKEDTAPTIEERVKKYEADAAIAKSGGRVIRIGGHAPSVWLIPRRKPPFPIKVLLRLFSGLYPSVEAKRDIMKASPPGNTRCGSR